MSNYTHELFLLAVNLSQYKSKVLIIKVFTEGLNTIFTPHTFEWYEEKTKNNDSVFEVCTRIKKYGYINHNKSETIADDTFSLLQNAVQMLAILLEKLEQDALLNDQKEHLKQLVDKQTFDLLERQVELQNQNEEYEALNEELRQTNEALQSAKEKSEKNENKLNEAQSLTHIGNWELDLINNELTWSDEIYRIFDHNPQEFGATYEAFLNFIHPHDRDFVNNSYLNHLNSKTPYDIVHRILLSNGEVKYVNEKCKSDFNEQGKPLRSVGTVADITDKIKSEEVLHRTQYSIDNITDSIFWIDKSAQLVFANQAACRNLEYSIEELLTLTVFDIDPEFSRDEWEEHWNKLFLQGSFTIETYHCTKTRRQYPVEVTTNKVEFGGIQYNCAIARDITERKKTEAQLLESEQLFRALVENSPDFIGRYDLEFRRVYVNPALHKLIGGQSNNIVGHSPQEETPIYAPKIYIDHLRQAIMTGAESTAEIPYRSIKGEIRWGHQRFVPETDPDGKVVSVLAIGRDVNEIKEKEQSFRMLAENFPDYVFRTNREGQFFYINPTLEKALSIPADAMIGKTFHELLPNSNQEKRKLFFTYTHRTFDEGVPIEFEAQWDTGKGEHIFDVRIIPEKDAAGNSTSVLGIARDITESRQAEQDRQSHLRFFESMDKVNRAIQGANDIEQMMSDVLDTVLSIFDCDRAFLLYPLDPNAGSWTVPMIRCRKEYPASFSKGAVPMDSLASKVMSVMLASEDPVKGGGPETDFPLTKEISERFDFKSFMAMALYPKVDTPWEFAIHQCSYARVWNYEEERLFKEICRRMGDALTSLLSHRNLLESEEKYRLIVETTSEGIWMLGIDLTTTFVNTHIADMTGYSAEELIGRPFTYIMFAEDVPDHLRRMELRKQGVLENYESRIRHKDGREIWIHISATPIFDDEHHFRGTIAMFTDITERKRAEMVRLVQYNIVNAVTTTKNINNLFASIKNELNRILNTKNLFVALYNEKTGKLCSIVDNDEKDKISEWPLEKSLTGYLINQNRPMLLRKNDIIRLHKDGIIDLIGTTAEAWLGFPLIIEGKVLGAIVAQSYDNANAYDKSSTEILELVAHELSIFIDWQRAEEKSNKLSRAIEQSSVTVVITNKEGYIEYVNPFFSKLTGYNAEEVIGKNPRVLKSGHHPKIFYEKLWNTILSGKDWQGEMLNKKKNGDLYWEKAIISPIVSSDGAVTNFVAIKEDITERKKMVEDLVAAKEKAEESNRLKSAFLANMSHEIRTPMNGILGFTQLLLEPDLSSEQKESFIKIVHQSGQRMLTTVTDIIEISKIEVGLVNVIVKETDLNERVEELFRFFQPEAEKKGLKLILEMLLPAEKKNLLTDQNKLDSILSNLIKNAIKYTESGTIKVGCRTKGAIVEFYIKDTGIGIPKDRQEAIFERFMQADIADTRVFEGSGLGLAIAKSYVEILGGKIWVESREGIGSTFYFTLPVKNNNEEKSIVHDEISYDYKRTKNIVKGLKILIAKDDEPSRNYVSLIVKGFCKEILVAGTGIEAVELCRDNKDIDLILMDIKMPGLNGYEATRRIREFNKEVIIIAQTAYGISGDREKAKESGCNDYIAKPINKNELLAMIQKYFGK